MASNLLLIVLLVLFSLSVTSVYSLSTRDTVSKQEDESYFMAMSDQGSSMINVDDLAKARSLQALVAGSKVVKNKKSKSTSTKSTKQKRLKVLDKKKSRGHRKLRLQKQRTMSKEHHCNHHLRAG
ncbi:unnamed protein product [Arabis nemorensis]|uniref:BZIP domain-containing protein n=1 Tax=Arabis nemorensis TaxID=586526 RepID=A0A565AMS5_9BRAS|nr:unnamed protein product [Arabis nemorensis]